MTPDKVLTWFIRIWIGLLLIVAITGVVETIIAAPTVLDGLSEIRDELGFSNYRVYLVAFLALCPALLALGWRDGIRKRAKKSNAGNSRKP